MVPMKEARIALYRMVSPLTIYARAISCKHSHPNCRCWFVGQVNLGYIRVQEVPKSADYNPKNTIYIFEAKIEETCAPSLSLCALASQRCSPCTRLPLERKATSYSLCNSGIASIVSTAIMTHGR